MNIPRNQEHFEAVQSKVDEIRAKMKESLKPNEVEKLEFLEDTAAEFKRRGIPFALFASINNQDSEKQGFWQFHRFQWNNHEDVYSKECIEEMRSNIYSFLEALAPLLYCYGYVIGKLPPKQ